MKKILGLAIAGVMTFGAMAAVAENENKLVVNNNEISAEYIKADDGTFMIPLRAVCEELGFTVNWIEESRTIELIKGALYITCSPDADGYAFSRRAHQPLGKAPMLVDGTTYVPAEFISEILYGRLYPWDTPYAILVPHDPALLAGPEAVSVYATEIGENTVTVVDFTIGEVILNITEDTEILDAEGKELALADIDSAMQLEVVYDDAMTASIPARTNAVKIQATGEIAKIVKEGTVTEIIKDEEGNVTQLILGENEVALNVAAETVVKTADGEEKTLSDIEVGASVKARTNGMATMSIPAQMPTLEIVIF